MSPVTNPPEQTLDAVRAFATRMQPEISFLDKELFGRFVVEPHILMNLDEPHFKYSTEDGLSVRVDLSMTSEIIQICGIQVLMNGDCWSVDRYNIICKTSTSHELDTKFPVLELRWRHEASPSRPKGNLEFVWFRASEIQGVMYDFSVEKETRHIHGSAVKGLTHPELLRGASELHGIPLDWKIDTDAKEREIIERSAIYEFMALVPFRDGTLPTDPTPRP